MGSRLYNFQNNIVQQRIELAQSGTFTDPSSTVPLHANSSKQDLTAPTANSDTVKMPKTSLIDIPRILPSFFNAYASNNQQASRNSKASKFMNTVKIKSASFKRALFPNYSANLNKSSVTTTQTQAETFMPSEVVVVSHSKEQQQIVALSSMSSSATTSSSSTSALAVTPPVAAESVTVTTSPGKTETGLMQSVPASLNSLSREKAAL